MLKTKCEDYIYCIMYKYYHAKFITHSKKEKEIKKSLFRL